MAAICRKFEIDPNHGARELQHSLAFNACDLSMIRCMREIRTEVNAATAARRNAGAVTVMT
jgi:hypothetical protein